MATFLIKVITGIEPAMTVLQTVALPLGHITMIDVVNTDDVHASISCVFLNTTTFIIIGQNH